jgi:hypothetical protein
VKGENKDKMVKVKWQDDFTTDSRFIYYGQGTRNEYRITRFGKGFPFFEEDNVGDLLIIAQQSEDYYYGFVLQTDQDIDDFFAYFNLSPEKTNQLIDITQASTPEKQLEIGIQELVALYTDFPETRQMAQFARDIYNKAHHITDFHIAVGCGRYTEMVNNNIQLYLSNGSTSSIYYMRFDFQNTIQGNRIPTFIGNKHGFWILSTRYYGTFNYYGEVRRVLSSSAKMISMGALINDDYASKNWGGVAGVAAFGNANAGIMRISSRITTATAAFVDYGYFLRDKQTNIPIESNFNDYIIIENKNGIFVPTSGAIVPGVGYCMYKSGVTIQPHIIKSPFADEFLFVMNSSSGLFYFNLSDWDVSTPYVQQELITHAIT